MKPFIITNFKHYPSAVLENTEKLTLAHIEAKEKTGGNIAIAVSHLDIQNICNKYSSQIDIYAQHCDNATFGSSTGKILPEMLKKMGATGVILNHSENRFSSQKELFATIEKAKESGLTVVCCAETADEGKIFSQNSSADFIAVEPPELIGGDISISTSRPELISESVEQIGQGKVLVGAGVKNGKDVRIATEKGAMGVLLASGVTKAENPVEVLIDLVS